ncbi:MAG: Acetyl-CoA synthetase, partial [uncultured Acetobacteraceae bacterium]
AAARRQLRRHPRRVPVARARALQHGRGLLRQVGGRQRAPRPPAPARGRRRTGADHLRRAEGPHQPAGEHPPRARHRPRRPRGGAAAAGARNSGGAPRRLQARGHLRPAVPALRRAGAGVPPARLRRRGAGHGCDRPFQARRHPRGPAGPVRGLRRGRAERRRPRPRGADGARFRRFRAGRHGRRRPRGHHLHLRHHRQPEGRAARAPRPARPPAGRGDAAGAVPPARRPVLDAGRLGLDRRPVRCSAAEPAPRRARAGAPHGEVRPGVRAAPHGRTRRPQRLPAADRAEDAARRARPGALRPEAALDRQRRRDIGRGAAGLGARRLRLRRQRVLRPDRVQPCGLQLLVRPAGAAGEHGPRRAGSRGRGGGRRGPSAAAQRAGHAGGAPAGPGDVPRLLEQPGGHGRQVRRRLAAHRRPGRPGRRRLLPLRRPRGRRHHLRRLPHRPRRDRGLPAAPPRRVHGRGGRRAGRA